MTTIGYIYVWSAEYPMRIRGENVMVNVNGGRIPSPVELSADEIESRVRMHICAAFPVDNSKEIKVTVRGYDEVELHD